MHTARSPMRQTAWVAAGLATLALGWLVSAAPVPLYDGIGFPDEPYRYVADAQHPQSRLPPGPATARMPLDPASESNAGGSLLVSDENGPQVTVFVPARVLQAPQGQTTATVLATPRAPDQPPQDGQVTGNVYRVTATAGDQPVGLRAAPAGKIILRAPVGFRVVPTMEFRAGPGRSWSRLPTTKVGNDIFQAPFARLGDYALVLPGHGTAVASGSGQGLLIIGLSGLAGVLLLVGVRVVLGRRHVSDISEG